MHSVFEIGAFGDKLLKYHEPEEFGVRRGFFSEHAVLDVNSVRCDQHHAASRIPIFKYHQRQVFVNWYLVAVLNLDNHQHVVFIRYMLRLQKDLREFFGVLVAECSWCDYAAGQYILGFSAGERCVMGLIYSSLRQLLYRRPETGG